MIRRIVVALGLVAAAVGFAPVAAAAAVGYCSGAGVNVVVDFGALGGGVQRGCDPGGDGEDAWQVFEGAGFRLTAVQRFPGAVCRVDAKPSDGSCVQMPATDAFWGLFSSHGAGWSFASVGPTALTLSNGDTVAFAWQGSNSRRSPGTTPASPRAVSASATPTSAGKASTPARSGHGRAGHTKTTAPTAASTPAPTATASPAAGDRTGRRAHAHPPRATATPTGATSRSAAQAPQTNAPVERPDDSSGLPWWVPVGTVVLLVLGGGGAALQRRRGVR